MALEKDLELLDDYLSNRLSEQDKASFEQKLEADPELKKEMQLQQHLIEGIQKQRMLELKAMLNNIPVAPVGGQAALLTKVVSSVIVAGLVTTAVYWYYSNEEPSNTMEAISEEVEQIVEEVITPEEPTADEAFVPSEEKAEEKKLKSSTDNTSAPTAEVKKPQLDVYTPESEDESVTLQKERDQVEFITKAFVTSSVEVDVDSGSKKYNFHYIFKGGKLILYGSFENNLYEILEFIAENKRTVFLYHKTSYYLLDEQVESPTPLVPIRDTKLIKKLQEQRVD